MKHRPLCKLCGRNPVKKKYGNSGPQKYKTRCATCDKLRTGYKAHRKETCEKCGFVPVHRCQLHVDHIDGNHKNNDPANLQTLCANCHALKTYLARDHLNGPNLPSLQITLTLE